MFAGSENLRYRLKENTSSTNEEVKMAGTSSRRHHPAAKAAVSTVSGILFGIAIEKGRVFEPHIIREQMLLSNFTMVKMFLSASATSMLSFSLLSMIPATQKKMENAIDEFISVLFYKGIAGVAAGGVMLGAGMTLSGACPGMVLAQIGAAVPHAFLTVAGGLCGAFLYALMEPRLSVIFKPEKTYTKFTLDEYVVTPYFNLALPLASVLGLAVFTLELLVPWTSEVENSGSGIMGSRAWPPFMAGMLIGSLQIPVVLTMEDTLGSSTSYVTVAAQLLHITPLKTVFPYLKYYMASMINWWQVFYVCGAVWGAHVSATASDTLGLVSGVGAWPSFCGGVLMIFGSRLAGGCTSGHGLSGMGLLSLLSFVAVPAMFAGGISTALLMKYGFNVAM